MINKIKATACLLLATSFCYAKKLTAPDSNPFTSNTLVAKHQPLVFWENKGQITDQNNQPRADIQYKVAAANGLNIFIGNGAIHYQFTKCENMGDMKDAVKNITDRRVPDVKPVYTAYRMDVELVGANKNAKVISEQKQDAFENYYTATTGKEGAKVSAYAKVTYKDIYPNIDWVLYSKAGKLKHEFVVKKGGKVNDIKLKYGGADNVKLNSEGHLIASTGQGTIDEDAPYCFQRDGKKVEGHFKVAGDVVSYDIAQYAGDLVIDPSLAWVVYFGPTATDASMLDNASAVTTDASGNVYMAGYTKSVSGLATSGAYSTTYSGGLDAFLVKYDAAGALQWATYYGGSDYDIASALATDAYGNICMAGYTKSTAGIATPGAYQETFGGGSDNTDAYLVVFDNTGARLWATYYGGSGSDYAYSLSTDVSGNIYMAGSTNSTSAIATTGAYQEVFGGVMDGFLVRFSPFTTVWGTYFGGPGDDQAYGVKVDNLGNPCIVGNTASETGIASPGAFQPSPGSANDAFLARFDASGTEQWATYYGGTGADEGHTIATDMTGNIYIAGLTNSAGMATPGVYQSAPQGGFDGFVAKFDVWGMRSWSTYYGGSNVDFINAITVDNYSYICVTGQTASTSGIVTATAYQSYYGNGWVPYDAFFARFYITGTLDYGTYFGDYNIYEKGYAIAADPSGSVYIAGVTGNTVLPYDAPPSGDDNAFLFKIDQTPAFSGPSAVCAGSGYTYTHPATGGTWSSSDAAVATIDMFTGDLVAIMPGTTIITYTLPAATITRIIMVDSIPATNPITGPSTVCQGGTVFLLCATPGGVWASTDPAIAYVSPVGVVSGMIPGTVTISYTVANSCGVMTAIKDMTVNGLPSVGAITGVPSLCIGDAMTFIETVSGGTWSSTPSSVATVDATSGLVTGESAGTATISYVVANSCGTGFTTQVITINAVPATPVVSGPSSVCASAAATFTSPVSGGGWMSSDAGIASVTSSGVVSGVAAGTATISYTITNSCGSATGTKIIAVNPLPVAGTITGADIVCVGSSITLADATTGGTWLSDNTTAAPVSSAGVVSGMATGIANISYIVTNSCGTAAAVHTVSVNTTPASGPISGADNICVSGSTVLVGAAPGGLWTSGAPGVAMVSGTGLVTALTAGTVTITYVATTTCGTATTTKTLTVNALPVAGSITGADLVCVSSPVTFSDPATGGSWVSSDAGIATVSAAGLVSGVAEGVAVISYAVTNMCGTATATKAVTINLMPAAGAITGVSTVCVGSTITMSNPAPGGMWSSSSSNAAVTTTGAVIGVAVGTAVISYTVTNSCGTASVSHIVTVTPASACGTTGLSAVSAAEFSLFPNPSYGTFSVVIPEIVDEVTILVTDVPGAVVLNTVSKVVDKLAQVALPNVAPGNYIVKVSTGINTYYQRIAVLK